MANLVSCYLFYKLIGWLRKYDHTLGNIDMIIEGICINPRDAAAISYYYHHKDIYSDDNNNYNNNNDINITPLLLMYFKFLHRTMAVLPLLKNVE